MSEQGESSTPTIDSYSMAAMCPGCKFVAGTTGIYNEADFTTDYTSFSDTFYGLIMNGNIVSKAFICDTTNVGTFCLEASDGSLNTNNLMIANHFFSSCEEEADVEGKTYCHDTEYNSNGIYIKEDGYISFHGECDLFIDYDYITGEPSYNGVCS